MDAWMWALIAVAAIVVVAVIVGVIVSRSRAAKSEPQQEKKPAGPSEPSEAQAPQPAGTTEPTEPEKEESAKAESAPAGSPAETMTASGTTTAPAVAKTPAFPATAEEPVPSSTSSASAEAAKPEEAAQPQPAQSQPAQPVRERPENSGSRLVRLRARLAHSANPFGKRLFQILSRDTLSEEDWEDVEDTLLLADVGADASEKIVDELRTDSRITGEHDVKAIHSLLRDKLLDAVGRDTDRTLEALRPDATGTSVIIMVGVNGTGKTTTAGKLGRLFVAEGKSVVMAAADTFRAAAADQLQTWANQSGIQVVRADHDGADPASVAFDAAQKARDSHADVLIVDTAGRLQNKRNLMDQLGKIRRVIERTLPVGEVLLVLDATTGQNGMEQARVFAQAIGITGVVLTKLDGSAKGGIVISVQNELKVPVKLVGLGEGPDDLSVFDPEAFVDGILGD